ncbi:ADP-ribosylglycohydrolase family protein [Pseudonocardia sp. GCM10023141]|uniref:ADP-ribosylglycohydrolase family protein n=1 Tax=Pseudonocardia sp. GCM10023141 TaxID=3252653 RepID=UPI003611D08A
MAHTISRRPDRRSRVRGSLLAGAVGDALGAPVEFLSLAQIRQQYGPAGVTELVASSYGPAGLVTDDTQMVLFTAEGLLAPDPGDLAERLHAAYRRWLTTQRIPLPPEGAKGLAARPWLYAQRAPGNACLSGLQAAQRGTPSHPVNPGSKGCGTVMRAAPFGLFAGLTSIDDVADAAVTGSYLTHGHPTAGIAAAAFAVIVRRLLDGRTLAQSVDTTLDQLTAFPGHEETISALRRAVDAAAAGPPSPERLRALGEGWVAEEALAMSVYCALAHPGPDAVRAALLLAVNHDGDSDSTGSLTGNLLGALHGEAAVPPDWAATVEGRNTIMGLADRLAEPAAVTRQIPVRKPKPADVARFDRRSRVRGMVLGLALGDALTRPVQPDVGRLFGTATSQLVSFTLEGLIRAMVRADNRGIGPSPTVVWSAYRRWGRIQGLPVPAPIDLTGWLHRVPALHERRGDAPTTVAALLAATDETPGPAPITASDHQALTRSLPLAAVPAGAGWIRENVTATHGDPGTVDAAVRGVLLVRDVLGGTSIANAARSAGIPEAVHPTTPLAALAPDRTALAALRGGVAVAERCPGTAAIADALRAVRDLPAPDAVGPMAGALLGAAHGADALPVELIADLELGWVLDTLARDLVTQLTDRPAGTEYSTGADPRWWTRYPGG